jgi:hypothetical protein
MSITTNAYFNNPLPYERFSSLPYGLPVADYPTSPPVAMFPAYTVTTMPANMLVPPPIYQANPFSSGGRQYPGAITKQAPYDPSRNRPPHRLNVPIPYLASYFQRPNDDAAAEGLPTQAPPLADLTVPQDGAGNPLMRFYLAPPRYEGLKDSVPTTLPLNDIVRPSTILMPHPDRMNDEPRLSSFFEQPQQIERPYIQIGELDMFPR